LSPKQTYEFETFRSGRTEKLSVKIEERGEESKIVQQTKNLWPGMFVVRITEDIEKQLDLPKKAGEIIVARVEKDTKAAVAGIRQGDIILKVNGKKVVNLRGFYEALNNTGGRTVMLHLYREGQEITIGIGR